MTGRLPVLALLVLLGGCAGGGAAGPTIAPGASATPGAPAATSVRPLKDAAGASGRLIGAAVQASLLRADATYATSFSHHFNSVTAENEMKWAQIERQQGQRDYGPADEIVAFAGARGIRVKGHTLVWHSSTPSWFEGLSPTEAWRALEEHIRTTVSRYRGRVVAWDVVNEAVGDNGLRDSVYLRKLGPGYVAEAFRVAHEADPDALLLYNDFGGEALNRKSDDIYALVQALLRQGAPLGGVGLQMHLDASSLPAAADIAANMRRLADLGVLVNISEMDVRIARLPVDLGARLEQQSRAYHDVVAVCTAEPRCLGVTFWGFTDAHSWIDQAFGADDPLLFDDAYGAKPAYYGVLAAL